MQTRSLLGDALFEHGRVLVEAALRGETATYERTLPGRIGADAKHFLVHLIPDIEAGDVQGLYMLAHDITAHKEAERRMIESETFLQRVEQVSGVGGFMIDLASGAQRWTHQCYRIHDLVDGCAPTMELLDTFLSAEARERCHESLDRDTPSNCAQ